MTATSLLALVGLALVHVFSVRLRFLDRVPRSALLSFGGGVAVALVFFEILPELGEAQRLVERAAAGPLRVLENHVYILAAFGLALFYGLELVVKRSRRANRDRGAKDAAGDLVFWLGMSTYAAKNATVGYLLVRGERAGVGLALFTVAIGLEYLLSDRGLHRDHKANYDRIGRWVLVAALLTGWLLGAFTRVPDLGLKLLNAFLGGSIILTVLKEELPETQQSRFWPFALGLAGYGALLLAL